MPDKHLHPVAYLSHTSLKGLDPVDAEALFLRFNDLVKQGFPDTTHFYAENAHYWYLRVDEAP